MIIDENGEIVQRQFFKTPYNHDTMAESNRTGLECKDTTKTQQHNIDEADINTIVNRFLKTGALPAVPMPPTYENFDEVFDFQTALNLVNQANQSFMAMDAGTRSRFGNDPAKFLAYVDHCMDTGDLDPLREMGLAAAKPAPDPEPKGDTPKAP